MKKFRILEKHDLRGENCFIPQYRKMWMWMNFYELECFPKLIKFYSLSGAKEFLNKQKTFNKPKIHYL